MTEQQPTGSKAAPRRRAFIRLLLWLGFALAGGAALAAALSGLGHRWDWWHFRTGFTVLRWAVYAALAGAGLSVVGFLAAALLRRKALMLAALPGLALGLLVAAVPLSYLQYAETVPRIHDITTDLENPPEFIAVRDAREAAPNEVAYSGGETTRQQKKAYPDIQPLIVDATPERAFDAALAQAREAGWAIAAQDARAGRIEATETSLWYGFKDDVVVRIRETEDGRTRIDVRSASRKGISDVGANAARVRAYLDGLRERLGAAS
jgi:uncharacterized protein (DUF1499 family)